MTDYAADIMYDIRKFLWQNLTASGIFKATDYYADNINADLIPILPVQQSPELSQFLSGKKHIVYDKVGLSHEDNWVITCEQVAFTIYTTDYAEINQIRNLMTDLFRRMDESATDMNRWTGISNKFKIYSIFIADISPTGPSEELKGFLSTEIILEIKYSRHVNTNGRFI
jgi:hypothetical protein